MDEVIFEEFKGTGNSEIILDRNFLTKEFSPLLMLQNQEPEKKNF